jgi:type III secretion protein U
MSGKDGSEERSLPATAKKLADARKKGQVARSRDFPAAAGFTAAVLVLWIGWEANLAAVIHLFDAAARVQALPFREAAETLASAMLRTLAIVCLPPAGAAVLAGFVANLVALRGIPFSTEPITPRLSHINPVEGFKRLFQMRALIELAKGVVKTVLIAAALVAVVLPGLQSLLLAPSCGEGCIGVVAGRLLLPMAAAAVAVFLVGGLLDLGLQSWLFRRDMRMSVSELKRERKDQEGDPMVRSTRRRERRAMVEQPMRLGPAAASLLVVGRDESAVGLRFVRGETPVPLVVCRASGPRGAELRRAAEALGVKTIGDAALAALLLRRARPGEPIPREAYGPVAQALLAAGAA